MKPLRREPTPYLEPEDSPYSPRTWWIRSYELTVARTLLEPAELQCKEYKEIATLVCLPSFEPEWALLIAGERKTAFSVLLTEVGENTWYRALKKEVPNSSAVPQMHQSRLPMERAEAICDIWRKILSRTRYPKESQMGCDGVSYHFAYCGLGNLLAGKTWSPEETSVPGKLVALGGALRDFVRDPANQDVFLNVIDDHLAWFASHSN